jgi:peptide/nickel transport system permease protein
MARFILRRVLMMFPTLLVVTILSFLIIQLPPGDFVDSYVAELQTRGEVVTPDQVAALRARFGLGQSPVVQYLRWMDNIVHGDFGRSLGWDRPVGDLLFERLPMSFTISFLSFIFVWLIGIPVGVFAATHQYSLRDYVATFLGFLGLAMPNFLFALIALWLYFNATGNVLVGLYSPEFANLPWSVAKLLDLLNHIWIPAIIVGTSGTAGLIRTMRANLLDELDKPYVSVARAKGMSELKLLFKYPFRIAMNPAISTIGWVLPSLVSGEVLTSLVLGTPTIAPVFLNSLLNQDMFLAGSIVLILSTLTVIGTLISDILLVMVDPRIRATG